MKFDYKIAAFDLDGTLSESKERLSTEMAIRLVELAKKLKVVVISGGSFMQFQKQFMSTWLTTLIKVGVEEKNTINNNLIFLPVCGTQHYFYDSAEKTWVLTYSEKFDPTLKEKVITAINKIIQNGKFDIPKNPTGPYIEDRGTQITFSALGQQAPFLEKQSWDSDQKKKIAIRNELAKMLPELEVRVGGTTSIDILPKGYDKAVGLTKLIEILNLNKKDVIFVGDAIFPGGNDDPVAQSGITSIDVDNIDDTLEVIDGWLKYIGKLS